MLHNLFSFEDLFNSFFDASTVYLWVKDTKNNLIKINKAAALLEGKSKESLEGKSCLDLYPEELAREFWKDDEEVIRTGEPKIGFSYSFIPPGAESKIWLQINKVPVKNSEGTITGIIIYAFDVTDLKKAEELTKQKEEQTRHLMDMAPFPIAITSLDDNKYLYINNTAAEIFDVSVEVALEKNPESIYFEKNLRSAFVEKLNRGEEIKSQEVVFKKPNGDLIYCSLSSVKINYNGLNCSYNVFDDITELKKNELKLSRIAEEFRLVFENTSDALFWADAGTGEIINCNRSAEELLLMSRDKIIGKKHWELHPLKDKELYKRLFSEVGKTSARGIQLEVEDASGNIIPVSMSVTTVNFERRRVVQATVRDVSQYVESEKALREGEEKYRAVVSNAPVVFFEIDKDGTFVLLEGKGLSHFNSSAQTLIGTSIYKVFKDYPEYLSQFEMALKGEKLNVTMSLFNEIFDVYLSPLTTEQGQIQSLLVVAVDITDKRKAELKLSYERNLLRTLIDIIPDLLYAKDRNSNFLVGNKKIAEFFGLHSPEELIGKNDFDFFSFEDANLFYHEEQSLISQNDSIINRISKNFRDGHDLYSEITKIPFYSNEGEVLGIVGVSKNVTERVEAEKAIRESELKYRHMAENMKDVIWQMSADMQFTYLSPSFYQLTGYQPEEFIGKSFWELISEDSASALKKELEQRERDNNTETHGRGFTFVVSQIHKENRVIWTEIVANSILGEEGELLFYQGIARDITQRKLAEDALKESQEKLSAVITNAPIVLFQIDNYGIFNFSDGKGLERLGLKPGQVVGLPVVEVYKDYPEIILQVQRALNGEIVRDTININNIFFEIQYNPILDSRGELVCVIGVAIDVTEKKQAEDAFLESEIRFRTLFHEMTEAVIMNTLVFDEFNTPVNYRIVEVNSAFFSHTGINADEAKGKLATEIFHTKEPPFFKEFVDVALTGKSKKFESYVDDVERYFKVSAISTGVNRFAVVFENITESRKRERELKDKNEELERFTYTVSHDLKSPLVTIKGFIGMLEQDLAAHNEDNIIDDINRIKSATDKMSNLLSDLLELSRIGRIINPPVVVSMGAIITDALELVSGALKERGVEVEVAENLPNVFVDKQRIVEVWQNLIENAVKFFGKQQNPKINIGFIKEDTKFIFSITDNGVGIDKKYHSTVFGLFNKLEGKTEGTGIGLALVKRIIEVHGGEIWVESEGGGKGTKFSFSISSRVMKIKTN